ncbi:hypothetical protein [Streptomyces sp. NBC_01477]|uniref:hypothetical protein n=1 Tax=Streptomyces sp. NBC_01477 TaxID=2976015 RepID=UPI002E335F04|nr:hypothetical protein [Streptomyces sp. NBC_01477]
MGARANYVVVRGGTWTLHHSHWGANRVATDLAYGPAAAIRCVRANPQVDADRRTSPEGWLDDVWCEGAALVDTDRRVLLWFSGEAYSWAEHAAHRAVLERTWPGWEVRWACDGIGDLHAHLGLGHGFVREPGFRETGPPYWRQPEGDITTVLTVRGPDGEVRAWGSGYEADEELSGGPGLLALLPDGTPPPVLTAMPNGGLHFDLPTRTLGVWTVRTVPGIHDWPLPAGPDGDGWDGWRLDFWGDDHRPHAARAAGRVTFPDVDPRPALADWRRHIGDPPPDPAALLDLASRPPHGSDGSDGLTAVANPAATVAHEGPDPTPAERTALGAVFDALLTPGLSDT